MATVHLELCRRNSIGNRYLEPTVCEELTVSDDEAVEILARTMVNGFYFRRVDD